MSDVLARIRVQETHGIRRFLYPLMADVALPAGLDLAARANTIDPDRLCLETSGGEPVPVQATLISSSRVRVHFGVSLAPGETKELLLRPGKGLIVNDPLQGLQEQDETVLHTRQQRFEIALLPDARIGSVVYDGISHLRDAMTITRNGMGRDEDGRVISDRSSPSATLNAWAGAWFQYADGSSGVTDVDLTACKSWATVTHRIRKAKPGDEIAFTLPFAVTSPILTYDLGLEGIYGKIDRSNNEILTWRMTRSEGNEISWSVANTGRTDYLGRMTEAEFAWKRWLHLIDTSKSLAVAITQFPSTCQEVTAQIDSEGTVIITFRMGASESADVVFGVCYHFLNDVPAIAAATNPQSILLPPAVEVLAV